jgi:hypothetical protein
MVALDMEAVVVRTGDIHPTMHEQESVARVIARGFLGLIWHLIRLPVLALLVILEPLVRLVLWGAAFLGVITAFVFEYSGAAPNFPFCQTIAISIGCMLLLVGYYGLIRLLS